MELVKAMGAKSYNPMPPDQHNCWRDMPDAPPLVRLWSLVTHLCLDFGHRSPYAVVRDDRGEVRPATIADLAASLQMDEANTRAYWREGIQRGLWRYGTKAEGESRLFLCGEVRPAPATEEQPEEPYKGMRIPLAGWMLKQIKDWPPERTREFLEEEEREREFDEQLRADLDAMRRAIIAQRQDTRYQTWGIKKIAQKEHTFKNGAGAAHAARRERVEQLLLPAFVPALERYAHTFQRYAQTSTEGLRNDENGSAHTPVSLLPDTRSIQGRDVRASASSDTRYSPPEPHPSLDEQKANQLPALKPPDLSESEKTAEETLFGAIRKMQQAYKHTDFGKELISPQNKADVLLVHRVLSAVGSGNILDFLQDVARKFRGLDKNALGKLPSRAPGEPTGPRSLGLILMWARDYGRHLDESARASAEECERVRANEISSCLELLRDPNETAEAKEHYRELLRSYGVPIEGVSHA